MRVSVRAPAGGCSEGELAEGVPMFERIALGIIESVRIRAKTEQRLSRIEVSLNHVDLFLWQLPPAKEKNGEIGGLQCFEAGNVLLIRFIVVAIRLGGVEDGCSESELLFQRLREQRHRAFGTIFMVAGDKHDAWRRGKQERGRTEQQQKCYKTGHRDQDSDYDQA